MLAAKGSNSILQKQLKTLDITNVSVSSDPVTARLTYPGLSPESYDPFGRPRIKSVLYNSVSARLWINTYPYNDQGDVFMDWPRVIQDRQMFVASAEVTFSRDFNRIEVDKSRFDFSLELGKVGTSSMCMVTKLWSNRTLTPDPLMTLVTQSVSVGKDFAPPQPPRGFQGLREGLQEILMPKKEKKKVKRSLPWPDWFKDKYGELGVRPEGLMVPPLWRPWGSFPYTVLVRGSDTDFNDHTNFTSYVQFAQDAVHAAVATDASQMEGFDRGAWELGVQKASISYQSESHAGESLTVYVWRGEARHVLFVSVEKPGSIVCQMTLTYFLP